MKNNIAVFLLVLFCGSGVCLAQTEMQWPREIETENYIITVYQPQPESYENNILEGRMAVSIKTGKEELYFCAAWFEARMATDLDSRTVVLESAKIQKIHFPDMEDATKTKALSKVLEDSINSWNIEMDLDRFTASLADIEDLKTDSPALSNKPPDIYFRTGPAILISIDGDPIVTALENEPFEYVVNTAFFIVRKKGGSTYYLNGGKDIWYSSGTVTKGWVQANDVASDIRELARAQSDAQTAVENETAAGDAVPEPIVVTRPSELIQTDGKPEYQSVKGSSLLYVKNSESDILMNLETQEHFILLAGRWYRSKTLSDGDWTFVEPGDLPEGFKDIPEKSDMASVRSSLPGTPEARDALLAQSIPQTASVDRKTATVTVSYDGSPLFKKIDGTDVAYAENADKTVLYIKGRYYCVDDGIWFVAGDAAGPWAVSDTRPGEVDALPPSSPVYNVKYVYVYDATPDVVHVGYYPGYCHSYVYRGIVVYGTGFWYRPWYRRHYFPRPCTYGFGVHWNPRSGWGFSFGFSYGWVNWRFHSYRHRYWGPRGYRPGYRHGHSRKHIHGMRRGYRTGKPDFNRPGRIKDNRNIYKDRKNGIVKRDRARNKDPKSSGAKMRPSNRANDVFTDRKGNVYQRGKDGKWKERINRPQGNARPQDKKNRPQETVRPAQLPANRPAVTPDRPQQNRPQQGNVPPRDTKSRPRDTVRPSQQPANTPAVTPGRPQQTRPQQTRPTGDRQAPAVRPNNRQREIPRQQLNRSHQNRVRGEQRVNRQRGNTSRGTRGGGRRE